MSHTATVTQKRPHERFFPVKIDKFLYKTNANPKKNILISENIGQRRLNFSRKYFDALFYHFIIISKLIKFKISSKYVLKKQLKVTIYHY